ncbi:ubiquitin carboxyl-terminal hydrolase 47 isoform X2 [Venturia canescens]|uniref:ubiquitin carboxyl-terminal hydrolase 47 isoform X2 n=1 Tax=Venturia canescens TaxID=32260 RepID=UPI001C9C1B82|nr:ubiquitin carboxyl-terminal hydrolase 47 isoform X2 [Venturia canescens]
MVVGMAADGIIIEIWDLACGGDEPPTPVAIPQDLRVADLVQLVSTRFRHSVGTFGLLLKWGRNKTNLMDVRNDLTIADLGVDFTTETDYKLLITEWPPSPSQSDELTMSDVDDDRSCVLLNILDQSRGFTQEQLVLMSARLMDLFRYVSLWCKYEPGTYSLILQSGMGAKSFFRIELNEKDSRKLNEIGVDLKSSKAMLLIDSTSKSPTDEVETEDPAPPEQHSDTKSSLPFVYKPEIIFSPEFNPSNEEDALDSKSSDDESQRSPTSGDTVAIDMLYASCLKRADKERESDRYHEIVAPKLMSTSRKKEDDEESEPNRHDETGYVGLVNQAMTCYLNSLIQALYMTPEFRNALYNWEYTNDSDKDEAKSIPYQLQKLFLNLQTSSKNAVETTPLTKSFGWDSTQAWQQHDIQELCRVMFDALEQKFKNTAQADLINRLYEGKMIDYVKCLECGTEKQREDTFLDIPLPVRPFGSNVAYNSVEEALTAFVQPETLSGTNQYHCETCNKKCDAHKGLKFAKFPYFLTLQLKRFDFDYNTFHRIKLNDEVTFPDILNLNSFIPSTSTESSCNDENSSLNKAKSDNGSTTDSVEDDSPPCNNGIAVNENSSNDNYDDDGDEGIERSNGPSTSSCNSHNHENEKKRDKLPPAKGPYVYELFSIMIHSGSASGGHYYAYIKDFRTGKWLCFNDQNVSTITYEDIQKAYGGGPTRAYYSGVYSSSSNAYMLMYRQIDPARNALPMQVSDFPEHLQELLVKTQESEESKMLCRRLLVQEGCVIKVYCHHPVKRTLINKKLLCLESTWSEAIDKAYRAMMLDDIIDRDQVRLVTYQESTGLILSSFEARDDEMLCSVVGRKPDTLLLEIRKKDEPFKSYPPDSLPKYVYVIDITKNEVIQGPIVVRARLTQTVQEYKEQLGVTLNMDPKEIYLIFQPGILSTRVVSANENTLQEEGYANATKVIVETSLGSGKITDLSNIRALITGLILINVPLPDVNEEELRNLGIPSLDKSKQTEGPIPLTNGPPRLIVETVKNGDKLETNETSTIKINDVEETPPTPAVPHPPTCNKRTSSPQVQQTETEDWYTPEQSNSEDSSLSYSDRTLVGEDDASEDDDYPLANIDRELPNQTSNQDSNQVKNPSEYIFKVTRDEHEPDKLLRVLYDKRIDLNTFKKLLEPYVGVPAKYFRAMCRPHTEVESQQLQLDSCFDDGTTVCLKLGGNLRYGEFKVSLYQLDIESETEPFRFLCDAIVWKEATVAQTKKDILADISRRFKIEIPYERCRLRRKYHKVAANVFMDDQKMKDIRSYWPHEIIIQELPGEETVTSPTDVIIFARRLSSLEEKAGPLQEIVLSDKSVTEVREKISQISGIPDEHLTIASCKGSLPNDVLMMDQHQYWHSHGTEIEKCSRAFRIEDGSIIYYRDTSTVLSDISNQKVILDRHYVRKSKIVEASLGYPRRRTELGLKIYLDDM